MAQFNEILAARYNRALQKLLQLKGGPPAATLGSDINANLNFFSGTETRYLEGWDTFSGIISSNAVAAQATACRIRNPAGSNIVMAIESWRVSNRSAAAGDTYQLLIPVAPVAVDLGTIVGNWTRTLDSRGNPQTAAIASTGADGTVAYNEISVPISSTGEMVPQNSEFLLLPGMALSIRDNTLNVPIFTSVLWRQRHLEEGERQ